MNRRRFPLPLTGALAGLAVLLAVAPVSQAQFACYPSYVTLSGTCPDSCGRGDDCPCTTCERVDPY